jgi:hypothetical protein
MLEVSDARRSLVALRLGMTGKALTMIWLSQHYLKIKISGNSETYASVFTAGPASMLYNRP